MDEYYGRYEPGNLFWIPIRLEWMLIKLMVNRFIRSMIVNVYIILIYEYLLVCGREKEGEAKNVCLSIFLVLIWTICRIFFEPFFCAFYLLYFMLSREIWCECKLNFWTFLRIKIDWLIKGLSNPRHDFLYFYDFDLHVN